MTYTARTFHGLHVISSDASVIVAIGNGCLFQILDVSTGHVFDTNVPSGLVPNGLADAAAALAAEPRECDCGAATEGKWADKHSTGCASRAA